VCVCVYNILAHHGKIMVTHTFSCKREQKGNIMRDLHETRKQNRAMISSPLQNICMIFLEHHSSLRVSFWRHCLIKKERHAKFMDQGKESEQCGLYSVIDDERRSIVEENMGEYQEHYILPCHQTLIISPPNSNSLVLRQCKQETHLVINYHSIQFYFFHEN
jgi:hypothetical protein